MKHCCLGPNFHFDHLTEMLPQLRKQKEGMDQVCPIDHHHQGNFSDHLQMSFVVSASAEEAHSLAEEQDILAADAVVEMFGDGGPVLFGMVASGGNSVEHIVAAFVL